jgi:xylan 1,4-beta-xylosidase
MYVRVILVLLSLVSISLGQSCQASFQFDLNHAPLEWNHYWERCVGSGHGLLGLRSDWQEHLRIVRNELGFQYVRFHGILDDDMSVFSYHGSTPYYSFYNIDQVYDFITSIGVKPVVELSFMPEALARNPSQTIFHYKGGISPPKNWNDWTTFITQLVTHLVQRYTLEEVSTWYFEVWNEPNCGFWSGTYQEYFNLLKVTSDAIHAINPSLKVGGPATCQSGLIAETMDYIKNGTIKIDFISTHIYPTDFGPNNNTVLKTVLTNVRNMVGNLPLLYTEYNDGLYSNPSYHDTPFAASFILKNIVDVYGVVDLLSWWTFTDIFEEGGQESEVFNKVLSDGWGLLSLYGIRKPSFRAFQLLHETGSFRIFGTPQPDYYPTVGSVAVANGTHIHVLAWNHDIPTKPPPTQNVCVSLLGYKSTFNKPATIRRIDSNNTNPLTTFQQMGSPEYPTPQQIATLRTASEMIPQSLSYNITGTTLSTQVAIPSQGVVSLVFPIP